eukprot:Phypoly_transcript_15020.p1 GENE.Phypoly_transcript_15020~~Phypoly_transcript_15020.p1  ORF type:complete len:240 (+),score=27.54 Phypoly_transcript_15020:100-720(+)
MKLINRLPQFHDLFSDVLLTQKFLHNDRFNQIVCLWRGDLLRLQVDAIVNSAHRDMGGGGGIDGKIQWKAGKGLVDILRDLYCNVGKAIVTPGFKLPCKNIIHAVASRERDPSILESCYRAALEEVVANNFRTIGFCCIGTGHYENPPVEAAQVALGTIREWLEIDDNYKKVDKIIFSVFSARDECIYEEVMPCYFPGEDSIGLYK